MFQKRPAFVALLLLSALTIGSAQTTSGELPRSGWLGAQAQPEPSGGIKIVKTVPGGTAATGLKDGDVLLKLDGREIKSGADLAAVFAANMPGKQVSADLLRDGKPMQTKVMVTERPRDKGESYSVEYGTVAVEGYRLRRLVSRPAGPVTPRPTLFLIQGIGESSMDFAISSENPYAKILKRFNDAGWNTVRMEKPGLGDSEGGPFQAISWEKDTTTFTAGFASILNLPGIDRNKIVIFGHSMGGVEGPMVAGQQKVAGLAVYGTGYKSWAEYFLENLRRQAKMAGAKEVDIDNTMRGTALANGLILDMGMEPDAVKKQFPSLASAVDENYPDGKSMSGMPITFWRGCYRTNIPALWEKVECPTLVMYGESEFIASRPDHEMIVEALNARKPGLARFAPIKNADHGFKNVANPAESLATWGKPGGEMQPAVLDTLFDWAQSVVK